MAHAHYIQLSTHRGLTTAYIFSHSSREAAHNASTDHTPFCISPFPRNKPSEITISGNFKLNEYLCKSSKPRNMQSVKISKINPHYTSSFSGQRLNGTIFLSQNLSDGNPISRALKLNELCRASGDKSGKNSSSGSGQGSYKIPSWEMLFKNIQFQEAAARVRRPLRNIVTNTSKRIQRFVDRNRNSEVRKDVPTPKTVIEIPKVGDIKLENSMPEIVDNDLDWNEWLQYVAEVEERENIINTLKFQLEDAIEEEDFEQAAKLKKTMDTLLGYDVVSEALDELKIALEEERYKDATYLRDEAEIGLIGWWVANAKDLHDPFGRIVNISLSQGRLLARSYTSRQLVSASEGMPIIEIFVKKDENSNFNSQPIYLRRESETGSLSPLNIIDADSDVNRIGKNNNNTKNYDENNINNTNNDDGNNNNNNDSISTDDSLRLKRPINPENLFKNVKKDSGSDSVRDSDSDSVKDSVLDNISDSSSEETVRKVVSFLREHIPGAKFKVFQIKSNESIEGLREIDIDDKDPDLTAGNSEKQSRSQDPSGVKGEGNGGRDEAGGETGSEGKKEDGKGEGKTEEKEGNSLAIGVIFKESLNSDKDESVFKQPERVRAKIVKHSRDGFTFFIENENEGGGGGDEVGKERERRINMSKMSPPPLLSSIPSYSKSEEMLKDLLSNKTSSKKMSIKMAEILKLAMSHSQLRKGLSSQTYFKRIEVNEYNLDPFSGLFLGAFGPHTSEAVQIKRKFGRWEDDKTLPGGDPTFKSADPTSDNKDDLSPPYEYVEAVKLTGDFNVPSGQVTFRAKISKQHRLSSKGIYPEGLGVVARYRGQGMLAEPGFKNPQWIDGELLLLDGKSSLHTKGAELGFVYSMPERNFLVLFNRLHLKN